MQRSSCSMVMISMCILAFFAGCARIVAPVGGPKDVTPPTIVKEFPANNGVDFCGNSFKITFNEFVVLENTLENVLISPPMTNAPTYTLSGKTLTVKIEDDLLPSQTYNFAFANCIKDFTEGNAIPIYNYAFSTGSYIDSFMLMGKVEDAITASAVDNCYVLAYKNDVDSLPLTVRPDYVTKTQSNGHFSICKLPAGSYKLFALKDVNNNLLFDQPNESIAFLSECVAAVPEPKTDTASTDSTARPESRKSTDTVTCIMRMFTEMDTMQSFRKLVNNEVGKYEFIYKNKVDSLSVKVMSDKDIDYFQRISNDTVTWYLKEFPADTTTVVMMVNGTHLDTLKLTPYKKKDGRVRGNKTQTRCLNVHPANLGDLHSPLTLNFSYPIKSLENFNVKVVTKKRRMENDTSFITLSVPDSFVTSLVVPLKLEEKVSYNITIRDSVFWGYNGLTNDSVKVDFTAKTSKDYGTLRMTYVVPDGKMFIAQLLNQKGDVIDTQTLISSQTISYENISEGNYQIKVVEDANGDGKWTTGNYRTKTLPEKIYPFPNRIFVRGNWEVEETFVVK